MHEFRTYKVNWRAAPSKRWDEMLMDVWATNAARKLAEKAESSLPLLQKVLFKIAKPIVAYLFDKHGTGDLGYDEEIDEWAEEYAIGNRSLAIAANLSYELMSCSSVALFLPNLGMVHARNLDWDLQGMKRYTVKVIFTNCPAGSFTAVSVPGFVGVLSGIAKGRFSATINLAPNFKLNRNTYGWAAPFLLRYVFEYCRSFEDAIRTLSKAPVVAPVFIQIVGIKKGQAAVIELNNSGKNNIYRYNEEPLVITNHYLCDDKPDGDDNGGTQTRSNELFQNASQCKAKSIKGVAGILQKGWVWNTSTQQSMVFSAKTGKMVLKKC